MANFVDIPITTDQETLQDEGFEYLASKVDGWVLEPAHPMTWLIEAVGRIAAETAVVASAMPAINLRTLGDKIYGIPRNDGTPAVASTSWVARDLDGHDIPAGTAISIDGIGFTTDSDATIAVGTSSVAGVLVTAIDTGTVGNVSGSTAEPIDALAWIDTIAVIGSVSGGSDAESNEDYQDRLARFLQLQAPRAITVRDFETFTTEFVGVDRAAVLDNYDPFANLLSADGSSFETGTGGWSNYDQTGITIARSTAVASDGVASLALSRTSTTGTIVVHSAATPISPGQTYTGRLEMQSTVARSVTVTVDWFSSSNNDHYISSTAAAVITTTTSGWTEYVASGVAPSNATHARVVVLMTAIPTGETHFVDKAQIKNGSSSTWVVGGGTTAERNVTVVPIDESGQPVSDALQAEILADLDARREVNFVVNVAEPSYNRVVVSYAAVAYAGYDKTALKANIDSAIADYLSPANWGQPPFGDERRWVNEPIIYYLQLAKVIEEVEGVHHVSSITLNGTSANVTMTGAAPLPVIASNLVLPADVTSGFVSLNNVDTTNLVVGMKVSGAGIPAGATIATITGGSSLNMTATATATASATNLVFTGFDGTVT